MPWSEIDASLLGEMAQYIHEMMAFDEDLGCLSFFYKTLLEIPSSEEI